MGTRCRGAWAAVVLGVVAFGLPACGGTASEVEAGGTAPVKLRYPGRAYAGAPPVIPHEVEAGDKDGDCLDCHLKGEDEDAPQVAHPALIYCRQCHVTQLAKGMLVASRFVGRRFGWRGDRAYAGAPPTVPHPFNELYGRCVACHSGPAPRARVTRHPERTPCRQCHVSGVGDP